MKLLLSLLIVLLTCAETPKKIESYKPVVVLELFTSQGCSSCPPADELLGDIKRMYGSDEVIALSYHVDYWNYIGWKDPFSKTEYSNKQRVYGKKFNNSSIYTPQMVVNGKEHFVGSNKSILNSKIKSYLGKPAENTILISNVKKDNQTISFDYKIEGGIDDKHLSVALVIDERTTSVSRGENKNRKLKNSNIVIEQTEIELNSTTGQGSLRFTEMVKTSDKLSLIALIENIDLDIVGASQLKL
ncbi:MAG: DUF1223 domain-containing protein [Gelidibacter sp.]